MTLLLLAALAASSGCTMCQSCDDYTGSYYGGRVGDWPGHHGRAGSVYASTTYDEEVPYEAGAEEVSE